MWWTCMQACMCACVRAFVTWGTCMCACVRASITRGACMCSWRVRAFVTRGTEGYWFSSGHPLVWGQRDYKCHPIISGHFPTAVKPINLKLVQGNFVVEYKSLSIDRRSSWISKSQVSHKLKVIDRFKIFSPELSGLPSSNLVHIAYKWDTNTLIHMWLSGYQITWVKKLGQGFLIIFWTFSTIWHISFKLDCPM